MRTFNQMYPFSFLSSVYCYSHAQGFDLISILSVAKVLTNCSQRVRVRLLIHVRTQLGEPLLQIHEWASTKRTNWIEAKVGAQI